MEFVGAIDAPEQDRIAGWAVTRFGDVCEVTVTVNGSTSFTGLSEGARPDLAAKQQSRGAGGFRIDITSALRPGINAVEVRFPDGTHVPGSPVTRRIAADWVPAPAAAAMVAVLRSVPHLSPSDLEEISLDDVGYAVEHGVIDVPARTRQSAMLPQAVVPPVAASVQPAAPGLLARLFRSRAARASA